MSVFLSGLQSQLQLTQFSIQSISAGKILSTCLHWKRSDPVCVSVCVSVVAQPEIHIHEVATEPLSVNGSEIKLLLQQLWQIRDQFRTFLPQRSQSGVKIQKKTAVGSRSSFL